MTRFASHDAYAVFAEAVRTERRFLGHSAFLDALRESARSRVVEIPQDFVVWRAQLGAACDEEGMSRPLLFERMIPLQTRAREGRANPSGIACFYCANDAATAVAEVRPWVGQEVSVARFCTVRPLRVVSLVADSVSNGGLSWSVDQSGRLTMTVPPEEEWEALVWGALNLAFSRPIVPSEEQRDYAPTQIVVELFRTNNYDGITFRSSVATGVNLALFDVSCVRPLSCHLHVVKAIEHRFEECTNPSFVAGTPGIGGSL